MLMRQKNRINFPTLNGQPAVNICIFKNQQYVDLKYDTHLFDVYDLRGNKVLENIEENRTWRIKIKQANPAKYQYYLILRESVNLDTIKQLFSSYQKHENNLSIVGVGGDVYLYDKAVTSNKKYVILAGPFVDERDARHHSKRYRSLTHCRIHRQLVKPGSGVIEIFDSEFECSAEVKNGVKLIPKDYTSYFELQHFEVFNSIESKLHHENLFYRGALIVKIDEFKKLTGVNEIPVESYLKGVLCSEIGERVSLEYAKSMAIVGRSEIFARLGQKHFDEDFDFCNDGHCLRYFGEKCNDPVIEKAVTETDGMVLGKDNKICNAYFTYSCGGHTENASGVWLGVDFKFSKGKYDGSDSHNTQLDLTQEKNVREWILNRPNVYCKLISKEQPQSLKVGADSFRWEIFYTRNELENILRDKTGEEAGIIYEIIPLKRGVSGRIREIEILGSLKNVRISGELNIRSAFSKGLLNSSCFYIEPEVDGDGVPISFLFIGAGKGHGVGLCKVGAAMMAKDGKKVDDILTHYFENSQINKIY